MTNLVEIEHLNIRFTGERTVHAVNDLSLALGEGEVLGLLGESGSGKSVTLRALMRLLPRMRTQISGSVRVLGNDVLAMNDDALSDFRGRTVSMIFQEPALALDPVYTIGRQIAETVMRHEGKSQTEAMARALEMLEVVRIPSAKRRLGAYPHEMSGGMRQRAMIALALSCKPKILLADEPTTALDATVQIQILLLLRELQREFGMSVIFVTHDIGVAIEIALAQWCPGKPGMLEGYPSTTVGSDQEISAISSEPPPIDIITGSMVESAFMANPFLLGELISFCKDLAKVWSASDHSGCPTRLMFSYIASAMGLLKCPGQALPTASQLTVVPVIIAAPWAICLPA